MSGRCFQVEIDGIRSSTRMLKVGCVQGSILGPRLFTIYMRKLEELCTSTNIHLTAYADDTYVCVAGPSTNEIKPIIEEAMGRHDDFLLSVGMRTNVAKTELIYFSRKPIEKSILEVKNQKITPSPSIKILGIKFDEHFTWETHFKSLKKKAMLIINKLKFLEKLMNRDQMKRILTSHFFGTIYYGSPVWLTELTSSVHWKAMNSLHYRALRTAVKDNKRLWHRQDLNKAFERATPIQWMKYSCSKLAINLYNLGEGGPPLSQALINSVYVNDRNASRAYFRDTSRTKIGRHSIVNRISCIREIKFDWTKKPSTHVLRIELKKTFIT